MFKKDQVIGLNYQPISPLYQTHPCSLSAKRRSQSIVPFPRERVRVSLWFAFYQRNDENEQKKENSKNVQPKVTRGVDYPDYIKERR